MYVYNDFGFDSIARWPGNLQEGFESRPLNLECFAGVCAMSVYFTSGKYVVGVPEVFPIGLFRHYKPRETGCDALTIFPSGHMSFQYVT